MDSQREIISLKTTVCIPQKKYSHIQPIRHKGSVNYERINIFGWSIPVSLVPQKLQNECMSERFLFSFSCIQHCVIYLHSLSHSQEEAGLSLRAALAWIRFLLPQQWCSRWIWGVDVLSSDCSLILCPVMVWRGVILFSWSLLSICLIPTPNPHPSILSYFIPLSPHPITLWIPFQCPSVPYTEITRP